MRLTDQIFARILLLFQSELFFCAQGELIDWVAAEQINLDFLKLAKTGLVLIFQFAVTH
jgi:hypothetical protein